MGSLNEDLDDSALCTLSLIQKRKASNSITQKKAKQAKLDFNILPDNGGIKQSDENLKLEESTSMYFQKKNQTVCPLCFKAIHTDAGFTVHTKSCAKKCNMSPQELLKALELQKKHMEERNELGLSSQVAPWNKKSIKDKVEKNLDSYDVALGIALSKSMQETQSTDKGMATLEEFGFKTNQGSAKTRPNSKKNKLLQKSILKARTVEERQRLITEKVAVVLLNEDVESDIEKRRTGKLELNGLLGDIANEASRLWNLGDNEGEFDWYVKEVKPLILTEGKEVLETQKKEKTPTPSPCKKVEDAIAQLNLPTKKLCSDWRKMINNSNLSDLVGRTKDSKNIYLHSLVLHARCENILEKDFQSIFEKFDLLTVLIFVEFLYCGTLNTLIGSEVKNLSILATEFDCEELIEVLNRLETSGDVEKTPEPEITIIESHPKAVAFPEDKDLFVEDLVDLTQSSFSTNDEKGSDEESNVEKSFWSFMQQEKKREEEFREEEEKETSLLSIERGKIETNMKLRDEQMQRVMESEEEAEFRDSFELQKIRASQEISSPAHSYKENLSECIILSSDSETRWSRPEIEFTDLKSPPNLVYEVPGFDPYDDIIACTNLSPVDLHSESLISGNILPEPQENKAQPGYCSTPVSKRRSIKARSSSKRPLIRKRSDLSASRIIRKSLNLQPKRQNSIRARRKNINKKKTVEVSSNSVRHDLSKSFSGQYSTPKSLKNFVELTPLTGRDEFGETVTPSPNYSSMRDSVLKEHLSRYGLKKSIGKSKAKKILRHIYDELHPRINPETGKIVKILSTDTPTRKKIKTKRKTAKRKSPEGKRNCGNSSEETLKEPDDSLAKLTDHDSCGSEFEDLNEPLTQSLPNNPLDISSAFREFLEANAEYHTKILLYEPIWLEDLQSKLKEMFKKHFKLSDLMDYLDQKCITFRTQAQQKVNKTRAEKKSPQKKTSR